MALTLSQLLPSPPLLLTPPPNLSASLSPHLPPPPPLPRMLASFCLCLVPREIMEEAGLWISDSEQRTAQTTCQKKRKPSLRNHCPGPQWRLRRLMMLETRCDLIQHFLPCFIQTHPPLPTHIPHTHGQDIKMRTFH